MIIIFSDNKLQQKSQINLQNKKKKAHQKKITGFQVTKITCLGAISGETKRVVLDGSKSSLLCLISYFSLFLGAHLKCLSHLPIQGSVLLMELI